MEKTDARKLKTEAQQLLRHQVIRLSKAGKTYKKIAQIVRIQTSTACQFYKIYEKGGHTAVEIKNQDKIELFFLPSYSPELNPDDYLNCDLKAGVHSGAPARSTSQLKGKALSQLRMLQKKPGRVAIYFKHPKIVNAG